MNGPATTYYACLTWGYLSSLPGIPKSGVFATDNTTVIYLSPGYSGLSLESVSQADFQNGANAILIGNEIVYFMTVKTAGAGFAISTLLRGRRGTEWACGTHVFGEKWYLLSGSGVSERRVPLADLGVTYDIRQTPYGFAQGVMPDDTATYQGQSLMPWAPVNAKASMNGDGSVTLNWVRRTRQNGADFTVNGAIPLTEDSEDYEIYLVEPGNESAFVPTASGTYALKYTATSPTVTAPSADISGSALASGRKASVALYQVSGEVGRGFMVWQTVSW